MKYDIKYMNDIFSKLLKIKNITSGIWSDYSNNWYAKDYIGCSIDKSFCIFATSNGPLCRKDIELEYGSLQHHDGIICINDYWKILLYCLDHAPTTVVHGLGIELIRKNIHSIEQLMISLDLNDNVLSKD